MNEIFFSVAEVKLVPRDLKQNHLAHKVIQRLARFQTSCFRALEK